MGTEVEIEQPATELCRWIIGSAVQDFLFTYMEDDPNKVNPEKEEELELKFDELISLMLDMEK